ncbi:MAG: VOC family protein [Pseudomonadota bacterium]
MSVREGYRSVSAYLVSSDARAIKAFAEKVFGAAEVQPPTEDDGRLVHVALAIGDSVVLLGQPPEGTPPMTAFLHVYVDDAAAVHAKAVAAGAVSLMPPAPQPHGDVAGMVRDMGGNAWWIAQYVEDVPEDEMLRRMKASQT